MTKDFLRVIITLKHSKGTPMINLDQYITDRKLDIDPQAFKELNTKYEKKELISAIADLFLERKLDFPFPLNLTPETVESDFVELSKPTDLKIFTESKQLFKFEYQYLLGDTLSPTGSETAITFLTTSSIITE